MENRRIDPENRLAPDIHAGRALNRFLGRGAEDFTTARLRERGNAGEAFRDRVQSLLVNLYGRLTQEQLTFREGLESQAGAAASVWTKKFPIQDGPSEAQLEAGARAWLKTLSPQVMDGFLALCPETASLVVVPDLPVPQLLKILRAQNVPSKIWWDFWNQVRAGGWKVGITDGAENMPFDPVIYWENKKEGNPRTHEDIVKKYKRHFEGHGLGLMPPHGYVPSRARALVDGRVLDNQSDTFFERPEDRALRPHGAWRNDGLDLAGFGPDSSGIALRCRPWVEGELKF